MIGYMEGKILKAEEDGILLLVGHIGYEILLPVFVMEKVTAKFLENNNLNITDSEKSISDQSISGQPISNQSISLYIYYYQTERQPKPILIGFFSEDEKDFFQIFISVDAIGPLKAVKAMEKPISQIAMAIEAQDIDFLASLKGIGKRTAQKIVATLHGKVSRFFSKEVLEIITNSEHHITNYNTKFSNSNTDSSCSDTLFSKQKIYQQVVDVLVEQLGYTGAIAKKMVSMTMEKNSSISNPEELLDAVLHGKL